MDNSSNMFYWILLWYRLSSHQYCVKQTHFWSLNFYCAIREKRDIQWIILGSDSKLQMPKTHKEMYPAFQEQQLSCWTLSFFGRKNNQSSVELHSNSATFFTSTDPRIICMFGHTSYKHYIQSDRKIRISLDISA